MTQPLEALIELERRGAAPDQFRPILQELDSSGMLTVAPNGLPQIANVVELYARGVLSDQANPDFSQDASQRYYPIIRRLVGAGLVTPHIPQHRREGTAAGLARRVTHGLTAGFLDEIGAGLGAASDYMGASGPGTDTSLSEAYDYNLAVQRQQYRDAQNNTGLAGTAAEFVGGAILPVGRLANAIRGATVGQRAHQVGVMSAGYGGLTGFGEGEGGFANRIENAAGHAAVGYVAGGTLGAGVARYADWRAARAARTNAGRIEASAANQNAAGEFADAGVPVFAPAVSSSPSLRTTTETIMGSAVGQPLVAGANRSLTSLEARIGETLAEAGGRRASDEMGNEVQGLLRRNLTEHSIPGATINRMNAAEAEAISRVPTGPDYVPPRPRAEPVPPVEVQPVAPRQLTINDVQAPPVHVPPVEPRPSYRSFDAVTLDEVNPQLAQRIAATRAELDGSIRIHNERVLPIAQQAERAFRRDMNELFRALQRDPQYAAILRERGIRNIDDFINSGIAPQRNALGLVDDFRPIRHRYEQIAARYDEALRPYTESVNRYETIAGRVRELEAQGENARDQAWRLMVQNEHGNAVRAAETETQRIRISRETAAREDALRRAQAAEEARAADETARMRGTAQSEAEAATRTRQREMDAKYDADMASYSPRFEPGASRGNTYPTEFSAAYRQIGLNAPGQVGNFMSPIVQAAAPKRGNVMGKVVDVPQPNIVRRTATMDLVNDFGREARRAGVLRGWKDNDFTSPQLWGHLRQRLGAEVADRLRDGVITNKGKGANLRRDMPIDGLQDFRTTVRRASEAPFQPEDISDRAMLRRLYGAMTDDMHAMLRSKSDPKYAVAAEQLSLVDRAYGKHAEEIRDRLKVLFGDKVAPEQALHRLQAAAQRSTPDIDLLRKFYRVAADKGDVKRSTAMLLSNMAEGGVRDFMKRYGGLSNEAKKIMFAGNAGELGNALERLHRIGRRLEPYMIEGKGLDLWRVPNMMMGATLVFNIPTAVAQAVGMNGVARLLSSERFLNWLTAMPKARTPWSPQFNQMMDRLKGVAIEELGVNEAAWETIKADIIRNVRGHPRSRAA